jgi:membrane-associated protease RseP (regulator of RpoE activity)
MEEQQPAINSFVPKLVFMRGDQWRSYALHLLLFALTFVSTTLAGVQWLNKNPFELSYFHLGLPYSLSLLAILSAHEFGHYFAAKFHRVNTTLPFYIPFPPFLLNPFGTMGAVIRIRDVIPTRRALFDIGIAGPLAGLVVTVIVLGYGFLTLPPAEYLLSIHPEYIQLGHVPETGLRLGQSLLFWVLTESASTGAFVPPMNEIYHYPYLCAGWFGLFITALNLIPVGQLDGGHIVFAMVGKLQGIIARSFFVLIIIIGFSGFLPMLGFDVQLGTLGWLLWAAILFFLIKLDHPEIYDPTPLDSSRRWLGWITVGIFFLTFPPIPFLELSAH